MALTSDCLFGNGVVLVEGMSELLRVAGVAVAQLPSNQPLKITRIIRAKRQVLFVLSYLILLTNLPYR
jgi:predicted ATP-dependent endonuclease of OLD family